MKKKLNKYIDYYIVNPIYELKWRVIILIATIDEFFRDKWKR